MARSFTTRHFAGVGIIVLASAAHFAFDASAQTAPSSNHGPLDPGLRGGPAGAGGPLPGLGTAEVTLFNAALARFRAVDLVSGTINDAPSSTINGSGLGPRFNLNSCSGCHSQPVIGGTSPATNPQVAVATLDSATNTIPSFISLHGPVREARFIANPDGTPDGGVHDLFVITGRRDAAGCNIAQPNFAQAVSQANIIFRIPTPVFGAGQVENTPTPISKPMRRRCPANAKPTVSQAPSITAPTTAPSPGLAGKRRTSRC